MYGRDRWRRRSNNVGANQHMGTFDHHDILAAFDFVCDNCSTHNDRIWWHLCHRRSSYHSCYPTAGYDGVSAADHTGCL